MIARARAARVDHQLHQPGQHRHRRRCTRRRRARDRHLRHADRDVRGRRARARPAGRPLLLRLLRPESPRLAARGLLSTASRSCIASGRTIERLTSVYRAPLFEPAAARAEAAADRVSLLLLPARARLANIAARRPDARRGRRQPDRRVCSPGSRESGADPVVALQRLSRRARCAGYMQIEIRQRRRRASTPTGPSCPATTRSRSSTIRAIVNDQGAIIPLDVANRGNIPVPRRRRHRRGAVPRRRQRPAAAARSAPFPMHLRAADDAGQGLRARDGRRGADAVDASALVDALALNPLVPDGRRRALVAALLST